MKICTKNALHILPQYLITPEIERFKAGGKCKCTVWLIGVKARFPMERPSTIVLHLLRSKAVIKRRGEPWRLFQGRGPCWLWLTPSGCRWESAVCVCVYLYSCIQIKAVDPSPSVTPSSSILSWCLFIDREFQAVLQRAACRWSSCSRPSWFSGALCTPLNSEGARRSAAVNSICLQGASAVGGWMWACHRDGRVQTKPAVVTNQAPLLQ